jgi:hypothetical protein
MLLHLNMKCWNLAFNAQGTRIMKEVVQVGAVKIYVAAKWAAKEKEKTGMKFSLALKLVEKLVWVPLISFWKNFIPSYMFDALLLFSPPNCVTLHITPKHITNIKTWPVFACVSNGYLTKCKKLLGIKA